MSPASSRLTDVPSLPSIGGLKITPLYHGTRLVGHFWEDADAKYCHLGNLFPENPIAPRSQQTAELLETIAQLLAQTGMHFCDVVRTWFYLDQILDWYYEFNQVRTGFFKQQGITRIPASTGIGISNEAGCALVAKVIAVQPKTKQVNIQCVRSPLQCEAPNYGSAFSRAMEVTNSISRTLYVSGTASIEPGGKTIGQGDPAGQIKTTMEVITALLTEAQMELTDITRAIAYFRSAEGIALWHDYNRSRKLPLFPLMLVHAEICRDDLLFEIELDAFRLVPQKIQN